MRFFTAITLAMAGFAVAAPKLASDVSAREADVLEELEQAVSCFGGKSKERFI